MFENTHRHEALRNLEADHSSSWNRVATESVIGVRKGSRRLQWAGQEAAIYRDRRLYGDQVIQLRLDHQSSVKLAATKTQSCVTTQIKRR